MSKKGIFGLFKSLSPHSEEDERQRNFAKQKLHQEKNPTLSEKDTEKPDAGPTIKITSDMIDFGISQLEIILEKAGYAGHVLTKDSNYSLTLEITDSDDAGRLIGRDGTHIQSLQTLIRAMVYQKFGESPRVVIDIGNYQSKRLNTIKSKALRASQQLTEQNPRFELEPMSAPERREIHMMFKNQTKINCYSNGEGKNRHIILEKVVDAE